MARAKARGDENRVFEATSPLYVLLIVVPSMAVGKDRRRLAQDGARWVGLAFAVGYIRALIQAV